MKRWPKIKVGDILHRVKDDLLINDLTTYSRITIRMNGKGVILRDSVIGADIGTKRQFIARAGQFALSKIDARNGAFGVLPKECDNAIITGNFWVFDFDMERIEPRFFEALSKTPAFVASCVGASDGTTNRQYLKEDNFLLMEFGLPPLPEQCAIVARLDVVAEKVRQVEVKLNEIEADAEQLLAICFRDAIEGAESLTMSEVAPLVRREVEIDPEANYTELGIRSFFKGVFHRRVMSGVEYTWQKLYWVACGDLIFSNIMAWEQAIAVAGDSDSNCVGNHRMLTCSVNPEISTPGFLWYYFTTADGFSKILKASPGTAARNKTLKADVLMTLQVPTPKIEKQIAFDKLQNKIAEMKAKHQETRQELKALLPSMLEQIFTPSAKT
ncbi:MAG: hypothetical protein RIR39_2591 [Pseudomonadota bacterium]|jgi:type I restriction enzyme S subunit